MTPDLFSATSQPTTDPIAPALGAQRSKWMQQASSVPNLQCGKDEMFPLTLELVRRIGDGEATDLDARPQLSSVASSRSWRQYSYALRPMGLVQSRKGVLQLTPEGSELLADESPLRLASLLAQRIRLFAEVLGLLVREPLTVEEANAELIESYNLEWTSVSNTRVRMTWLEVLGLTEWLGERKQSATAEGRSLFATWEVVTPSALALHDSGEAVDIPEAPGEIAALLAHLAATDGAQEARNTYNIWVPSPKEDPNKIENLRTCIAAAEDQMEKAALLGFIADRFGLKRSSVDSMLPFMRAAGLLLEVRRGVFTATPAAKAWLRSGSDIDFIRILHANMKFVGELIRAAKVNVPRNDVYREGITYGLNKDKVRWLTAFMVESGLLIETSWSSVQATATGLSLIETLPLAEPHLPEAAAELAPGLAQSTSGAPGEPDKLSLIVESLTRSSVDPGADGAAPGAAFEVYIESAFRHMGFRAQRISGSGDTDILVQWYDSNGSLRTAIVDGKSTSSGRVTHNNVSDVAIDTHKEKRSAEYVAIIGPAFSGDTIKNMAKRKQWALITADELGQVVSSAEALGLRPADVGMLFEASDGLSRLAGLIDTRQRELDILSLVISRLKTESETEEAVSARDVSLIERGSALAPNIDELLDTFRLFDRLDLDIVRSVEDVQDPRYATYRIGDARSAAKRLRAIATAIESGWTGPASTTITGLGRTAP
ncbi:restriction endonuclease [Kitasatospora sp. NBC_01302]|uniref:restriction endonuclease n=1 Tax=Kitasatospora sp. NBC_01302 TaxID=2903575 RepID=UPI002E11C014|nr:restriction endonuclease [Kitasatospora sp. NBC_01302]